MRLEVQTKHHNQSSQTQGAMRVHIPLDSGIGSLLPFLDGSSTLALACACPRSLQKLSGKVFSKLVPNDGLARVVVVLRVAGKGRQRQ